MTGVSDAYDVLHVRAVGGHGGRDVLLPPDASRFQADVVHHPAVRRRRLHDVAAAQRPGLDRFWRAGVDRRRHEDVVAPDDGRAPPDVRESASSSRRSRSRSTCRGGPGCPGRRRRSCPRNCGQCCCADTPASASVMRLNVVNAELSMHPPCGTRSDPGGQPHSQAVRTPGAGAGLLSIAGSLAFVELQAEPSPARRAHDLVVRLRGHIDDVLAKDVLLGETRRLPQLDVAQEEGLIRIGPLCGAKDDDVRLACQDVVAVAFRVAGPAFVRRAPGDRCAGARCASRSARACR